MVKRHYVKPCAEIVQVETEGQILADSVGLGDEHYGINHGGMPGDGYDPGADGETGVVYDPNNPSGGNRSRGYNVWEDNL